VKLFLKHHLNVWLCGYGTCEAGIGKERKGYEERNQLGPWCGVFLEKLNPLS
jgi:hypothetical protein